MGGEFSILVVCVGNVCRSPLAERMIRGRLDDLLGEQRGLVSVASAGVRAVVGDPMDHHAATELHELGGSSEGFVSRQLTEQMVSSADLVLTATKELRSRILEEVPGALRRAFTIREFAALAQQVDARSPKELVATAARQRSSATLDDYDVVDPIGQSSRVHRQAADQIAEAVEPIVVAISSALREAERV